jgi:hypothetical protein
MLSGHVGNGHLVSSFLDAHQDHGPSVPHQSIGSEESSTSDTQSGDFQGVDKEILSLRDSKVNVDLLNNNNSQYYGDFSIGKNKQHFTAVFDTGSGITWVPGGKCTSDTCQEHHRFSASDSGTFEPLNKQGSGSIHYGTGEVRYEGGKDLLTFCNSHDNAACQGVQGHSLEVPSHPFGMSTHQTSNPFRILPFDGILGLAPSKNIGSVLHKLKEAKSLARNVIGCYLSEDTHRVGSMSFGGVEPMHVAPNHSVHWFPITRDDEWMINMKDIAVNGKRLHMCDNRPGGVCPAVVDTGSSLVTGPSGDIDKLLSQIRTPGDCSNMANLPQVSVILTDKNGVEVSHPLTPEEYTLKTWDELPNTGDNGYFKEFPFLGRGKEPQISPHCDPGIGIMDVPGKKWVLGDTFLRRYYSIYDDDRGLVGLVRSLHPDETPQNAISTTAVASAAKDSHAPIVAEASLAGPLSFVLSFTMFSNQCLSRRKKATSSRCMPVSEFL